MCCCFIAGLKSSLNLISKINKQQTGNERGQQFFWFVYFLTSYHSRRFSSSAAAQFSQARIKSFKLPVIPTANLILWHCSHSQSALQSNLLQKLTQTSYLSATQLYVRGLPVVRWGGPVRYKIPFTISEREWPFLTQPFFLIVVQNPINFAN